MTAPKKRAARQPEADPHTRARFNVKADAGGLSEKVNRYFRVRSATEAGRNAIDR